MSLVINNATCLEFWSQATLASGRIEFADRRTALGCAPKAAEIDALRKLPFELIQPYDVLVGEPRFYRKPMNHFPARVHVSSYPYPQGSFIRIGVDLFACSPELCFVQAAHRHSMIDLIRIGFELCSTYAMRYLVSVGGDSHGSLYPNLHSHSGIPADLRSSFPDAYVVSHSSRPSGSSNDFRARQYDIVQRTPLTSQAKLRAYALKTPGLAGTRTALQAIPFVLDNAASPREIDLAMRLTLPHRLGGFGLPAPKLNYRIDLGKRSGLLTSKRFLVADVCWPKERLVVEYDSTQWHTEASQLTNDAQKRHALEKLGYKVITVTQHQLDNPLLLRAIAHEIYSHLGRRLSIRTPQFPEKQRELFSMQH